VTYSNEIVGDGDGYFTDILRAAGGLAQAGITAGKQYRDESAAEGAQQVSAAEASAALEASVQADASAVEAMAQAAVADLFARRAKGAQQASLANRAAAEHAAADATIAEADRLAAALPQSVVAERSRRSQVRVQQLAAALKAAAVADKGKGSDEYQLAKARLDAAQMVANKSANLSIRRDAAPVPVSASGGSALDLVTRKVGPLPVWGWAAAGLGAFLLLRRR
jgi:MYXO-CTERM domain-containing protein